MIIRFISLRYINGFCINHDMKMLKGSWSGFYKSILVLRVTISSFTLCTLLEYRCNIPRNASLFLKHASLRVFFGLHFMVFQAKKKHAIKTCYTENKNQIRLVHEIFVSLHEQENMIFHYCYLSLLSHKSTKERMISVHRWLTKLSSNLYWHEYY